MGRLDGKVAVITGAASGIGAAAARLFAAEGAAVAVLDRDGEGAGRVAESLEGGKGLALAADVTDREAVEDAVTRVAATFGRVDVLYANAGVAAGFGPIAGLTAADLNLCLAVNVGELADLGFPDYGSRLNEVKGEPNVQRTRVIALGFARSAVEQDPRVRQVLSAEARPGQIALRPPVNPAK